MIKKRKTSRYLLSFSLSFFLYLSSNRMLITIERVVKHFDKRRSFALLRARKHVQRMCHVQQMIQPHSIVIDLGIASAATTRASSRTHFQNHVAYASQFEQFFLPTRTHFVRVADTPQKQRHVL